jgi:hypothetical protein
MYRDRPRTVRRRPAWSGRHRNGRAMNRPVPRSGVPINGATGHSRTLGSGTAPVFEYPVPPGGEVDCPRIVPGSIAVVETSNDRVGSIGGNRPSPGGVSIFGRQHVRVGRVVGNGPDAVVLLAARVIAEEQVAPVICPAEIQERPRRLGQPARRAEIVHRRYP